jgi:hypothetical protein
MGSKIVFFFVANRVRKTCAIQLVKGYQNHHNMALNDHRFVKKWGSKNSFFQILGYFKGITDAKHHGNKR